MVLTRAQRRAATSKSTPHQLTSVVHSEPSQSSQQQDESEPHVEQEAQSSSSEESYTPKATTKKTRKRTTSSTAKPRKKKAPPLEEPTSPPGPIELSATLITLIATKLTLTNPFWTNEDVLLFINKMNHLPYKSLHFLRMQMLRFLSARAKAAGLSVSRFLEREEHSRMYASTAMSAYGVTEKYLKDLPYDSVPNPHYENGAPARLFDRKMIRSVARKVHFSYDLYKLKKTRRAEKRAENALKRPPVTERRRQALAAELAKYGLSIRSDSRRCTEYIQRGRGDVTSIAKVMVEMQFYHNCTDYREFYDSNKQEARRYKGYYDPDEVSSSAKSEALTQWCEQFSTVEEALADPHLPHSLHERVRSRFVLR
ncbi:hypothetical protein RCL1_000553 [Eukaryota sp. TZLM3-RCL]